MRFEVAWRLATVNAALWGSKGWLDWTRGSYKGDQTTSDKHVPLLWVN